MASQQDEVAIGGSDVLGVDGECRGKDAAATSGEAEMI